MAESDISTVTFLTVYFFMLFVIMLPVFLINAVALMSLFDRAGEAKWKAWIPFINTYTRTKITFGEDRALWFLIDFFLGGLFAMYLAYNEARAYGQSSFFAVMHMFFQPITTVIIWLQKSPYEGVQRFILD